MVNNIAMTRTHISALLLSTLATLATGCLADAPSIDQTADQAASTARNRNADTPGRTGFPADAQVTVTATDCAFDFTAAPSPDVEAITMIFGETMLSDQRPYAHCQIGIDYTFPAGWQLWRPSATARGYQYLEAGDNNVWVVRTRLDGAAWGSQFSLTPGPANDNLQIDLDDGEVGGEAPTECGATSAHIDVDLLGSLFVSGPAIATVDTIDTAIDWAPCE